MVIRCKSCDKKQLFTFTYSSLKKWFHLLNSFCSLQLLHNFVAWIIKQHTLNKEPIMEMQADDNAGVHCNLSFKMTKDFKMHMLQHDRKKTYSCNQCGYSCISAFNLKKTLVGSQWRETLCLHTVQLLLHTSWSPQVAHSDTFRRKAFQLQTVQLLLHKSWCPQTAHVDPFRS